MGDNDDLLDLKRNQHEIEFKKAIESGLNILNMSSCGLGKTLLTSKYIISSTLYTDLDFGEFDLSNLPPDERTIVIAPTHFQTEGIKNLEAMLSHLRFRTFHFYGKGQRIRRKDFKKLDECYCKQSPEMRIFPSCKFKLEDMPNSKYPTYIPDGFGNAICPYSHLCEYNKQFMKAADANVIICMFENYTRLVNLKNSLGDIPETDMVIEEDLGIPLDSFKKGNHEVIFVKEQLEQFCDIKPTVKKWKLPVKVSALKYYDIIPKKFRISDADRSSLFYWFKSTEKHIAILDTKNRWRLYGNRIMLKPSGRIIYNDATALPSTVSKITGIKPDKFYNIKLSMNSINQAMKIGGSVQSWRKDSTINSLDNVCKLIVLLVEEFKTIAIITKLEMKYLMIDIILASLQVDIAGMSRIEKEYIIENKYMIDFITYGNARGSNAYNKKYDMGIVIGTYAYPPLIRFLLEKLCGLTKTEINQMEIAEMEQAIMRLRLIFNNTPMLYFLIDSIVKKINPNRETATMRTLLNYIKYGDMDQKEYIDILKVKREGRNVSKLNKWFKRNVFLDDNYSLVKNLLNLERTPKEITIELNLPKTTVYRLIEEIRDETT